VFTVSSVIAFFQGVGKRVDVDSVGAHVLAFGRSRGRGGGFLCCVEQGSSMQSAKLTVLWFISGGVTRPVIRATDEVNRNGW